MSSMAGVAFGVTGWSVAGAGALIALQLQRRLAHTRERVSRACHEVRGPLSAARLALTLGERAKPLSPPPLRAVDQELGRAIRAVEDLEAARWGSPTLALSVEAVNLQRLLTDSVSAWQAAALARGVALDLRWYGPPVTVHADGVRLAQALENLIANAIEHGGAPVEVCCSRAGHTVRIEVRDGGCGLKLPLAKLGAHRLGGARRGHGLAIAGAIAAAHGGCLASAPSGAGARLVLTLPLNGAVTRRRLAL